MIGVRLSYLYVITRFVANTPLSVVSAFPTGWICMFFAILVMVFDLLIIARGFVKVEGIVGKVLDIVVFALKVIVPVLLILAAINLIGTRIEGLGYIFFSNADVRKEVATPENVASATTSIVAVVFAGVAAVVSIVGAFFQPKAEKEEPQEN